MNKTVMTETVMAGLVGLVCVSPAYAGTVRFEVFPNTSSVMNEMIVSVATEGNIPVGCFARNRLSVGYDGAPTEALLQEVSIGNVHGFSPVAQMLLANDILAPRAGVLYRTTLGGDYGSVALSTSLVSSVTEHPLGEYRLTLSYTSPTLSHDDALRIEGEQHLWFNPNEFIGTSKLHLGYKINHLVVGVASEMDFGIGKEVTFHPGAFGRLEF